MINTSEVVNKLNTVGWYRTNVKDVLDNDGINLFNNNIEFFNKMLEDEFIQKQLYDVQTNPSERMEASGGKPFEITHYAYIKEPLTLNNSSFIKLFLNDFFTNVATEFLEVSNPKMFNVIAYLNSWNHKYGRMHSQNWHRDREDFKLLKFFIYYNDVTEDSGPFEYVPESFCGGKMITNNGKSDYWDYASDDENRANPNPQELELCEKNRVTFTGKTGDIIIVNNSGFHRGGFVKDGNNIRVTSHALFIKPDAVMIKEPLSSFNYESEKINYIDFESSDFNDLKDKQKYFKR
tara:strand:+ start:806 stop:1681 length:876 start_codon:yes stop_codon:yes gene_type:complete